MLKWGVLLPPGPVISANSLSTPEIDLNLYLLGGGWETGEGFEYFGAELSAPVLA
jgi:hypothetical protein